MTKRWPSTACLFGIGSVALVGVTACSERDLGRTQRASHAASDEQLVGDRERVERRAPDRIGNDFACAVISKRTAVRPRRLLVYVTSSEAADRARRFVGELKSASRIAVRTTSPQFRRRTMVEIRNSIEKSLPPDGTGAGIGLESPIDRTRCPRVRIDILPQGQAGPDMERWAEDAVRRFGRHRVIVSRYQGSNQWI